MMKQLKQLLFPVLAMLMGMAPGAPALGQPPETNELYQRWKDHVVQVQMIDLQAGGKAGIGSGFFVGEESWIVTNYHVVAELINDPGRFEARFVSELSGEGKMVLLAVDAVHDLAVLSADSENVPEPLQLSQAQPARGTRLWSMGYPFDIGLTIVEGTFNGPLQKSLYEKLHFTGSINPGMSGGPTLDSHGAVVGVNVSTAGNQVSFLVPAHHIKNLLAQATSPAPGDEEVHAMLAAQLLANQQHMADTVLASPLPQTSLQSYTVPAGLAEFINCWGNSEQDEENRLNIIYYRCQSRDDVFLSQQLKTGIIHYQHDLISTDSLGAFRFYQQLENRNYYPRLRLDGDESTVSNYACQSGFVDENQLPMKVTYCVRSYLRLNGLYDGFLSLTSLVEDQQALQSTLVLAGFSWENMERFVGQFLGAFSWEE